MATLFSATLDLAKILGYVISSTTTGAGTTTTLVDSARTEPDDFWNDGTIWITSGTQSGTSRKITDFEQSTGTFTFAALDGAPGSGVTYSVINGDWPSGMLKQFINQALQDIGEVPDEDISLTTVADQRRYALPDGVYNVQRLYIATETSEPYQFREWINEWNEFDGYIEFKPNMQPQDSGFIIRLVYNKIHPALWGDSETVSNYVPEELLKWMAAVYAWRWRLQRVGADRPMFVQYANEAAQIAERMKYKYPLPRIYKRPRGTSWRTDDL